jgi:hypothetical protein
MLKRNYWNWSRYSYAFSPHYHPIDFQWLQLANCWKWNSLSQGKCEPPRTDSSFSNQDISEHFIGFGETPERIFAYQLNTIRKQII